MTISIFRTRRRAIGAGGFTMIELLLVISVISILLGMLISTVRAVRRYSRQTITRGEIKNIEAAWKQFYAHYQYWPHAANIDGVKRQDYDGDAGYEMLAPLARMLEGADVEVDDASNGIDIYNADKITFLELSRFNRDGAPVNAWGISGLGGKKPNISGLGGKKPNTYMVAFDTDGDNEITINLPEIGTTNLYRSVVVWTENPEYVKPKSNQKQMGPPKYFGSWME